MFSTPEFWVFIAFVLLLAGIGKRALMFFTRSLDDHSQKVAHQLTEAQRLHDEAFSLLKTYKKKHAEALDQAAQMMAFAETEALEFKKSSEEKFKKFLAQKEKTLLERMTIETEETKLKLQKQTADEALKIVEQVLAKDSKERQKLTKAALKEISALSLNEKP
jgi:F-type H+-transporting ATPase subunit b